jgi:hypothetical protein
MLFTSLKAENVVYQLPSESNAAERKKSFRSENEWPRGDGKPGIDVTGRPHLLAGAHVRPT